MLTFTRPALCAAGKTLPIHDTKKLTFLRPLKIVVRMATDGNNIGTAAMAWCLPPIDAKTQIRLLTILPASPETEASLSASLSVVNLDQQPLYHCISYVWGTNPATDTISIAGAAVPVTKGLFSALMYIRSLNRDKPVVIWVDSICINQGDDEEKSYQVSMMKDIYRGCANCYIWLGVMPPVGGSADPSSSARTKEDLATATGELLRFVTDNSNHDAEHLPTCLSKPEAVTSVGRALSTMMDCAWWNRMWTLQECILAPTATLLWAPLVVDWGVVLGAACALIFPYKFRHVQDQLYAGLYPMYDDGGGADVYKLTGTCAPLHYLRRGGGGLAMDILWRHCGRQAADPRDLVYAALPLLHAGSLPNVPIDYSLSTRDIYQAVTRDLVASGGDLRPLVGRTAQTYEDRRVWGEEGVLPSWVFDWTRMRPQMCWWVHSYMFDVFDAARGMPPLNGEAMLLADGGICSPELTLSGYRLDAVQIHAPRDGVSETNMKRWHDCVQGATLDLLIASHGHTPATAGDKMREMTQAVEHAVAGLMIPEELQDPGIAGKTLRDVWTADIQPEQVLFVTGSAEFGFGPANLQVGDEIWILCGGRLPFLLRPVSSKVRVELGGRDGYELLGNVYLEGHMSGESVGKNSGNIRDVVIR
ncbi:HET domain-containing protein [Microdochium nivale]|nr:HET domain-containing protein [Microdochium nivale]